MGNKSVISVNDLSKDSIMEILKLAAEIEKKPKEFSKKADGKILSTLFYEPSTRTRLSFQSAMKKLGGQVLGFADPKKSSAVKGESIYDTIRMVEAYSDVVVIRHKLDGSARVAAEATKKPVINAGDGANQHPTQTLLDLYSILKTQGKITGLDIALVGDLKYGRTSHSLAIALGMFGNRLHFVAPESLQMPSSFQRQLKAEKVQFTEHESIAEIVDKVDILYMTRIQRERFPDVDEYEKVKNVFVLSK
ncbi:MAG: aspartate carbamoyltransferase, partial [Nanoarchaeota archaeon]|nr:aspartate carbamoyltransferase [Nanoarchaeota archaeon]